MEAETRRVRLSESSILLWKEALISWGEKP
jgi:hypothetical protein